MPRTLSARSALPSPLPLVLLLSLGILAGAPALAAGPVVALECPVGTNLTPAAVVGWGENQSGQLNPPAGLPMETTFETGVAHTLGLKPDGTVVVFGSNFFQQRSIPPGLSDVRAAAAGAYHSIALKGDGTVAVWGGMNPSKLLPPPGLSGVVAIGAGWNHCLAVKSDGSVVQWADDESTPFVAPPPAGLTGVARVVGGVGFTAAIKTDGSVVGWGLPGQPPASLTDVLEVRSASQSILALRKDGTLVTWGFNPPVNPQFLQGLGRVSAIASGYGHAYLVRSDGSVSGFGDNIYGQIDTPPLPLRRLVSGVGARHNLALTGSSLRFNAQAPGSASPFQTVVIRNPGDAPLSILSIELTGPRAADFDHNTTGLLALLPAGGQTTLRVRFQPRPDTAGACDAFLKVVTNSTQQPTFHLCLEGDAIAAPQIVIEEMPGVPLSSRVIGWGRNDYGQASTPTAAQTDITSVAVGLGHTLGLKRDGSVVAWGYNANGQTDVPAALAPAQAIAAGGLHNLALLLDGTVAAWGYNADGACDVPAGLTSAIAVAGGGYHSLALRADGEVLAWGASEVGQTTVPPAATAGVSAIAAGRFHSAALKAGGVITWGYYDGLGPVSPVPPAAQSGVKALACGLNHTVALKSDGTVVAWGFNGAGQTDVPSGLTGVVAIAAGDNHTVARKGDGTVVVWGDDSRGQMSGLPAGLNHVQEIAGGSTSSHVAALALPQVPELAPNRPGSGVFGAPRTLVIKNTGAGTLTAGAMLLSGDLGDFVFNTVSVAIPPGGQSNLTLRMNATTNGLRRLVVRVQSNDPRQPHFDFEVTGRGFYNQFDLWSQRNGQPNEPTALGRNGVANALNYAFGLDPNAAFAGPLQFNGNFAGGSIGRLGLPTVAFQAPSDRRFLFVRFSDYLDAEAAYVPEYSNDLRTWASSNAVPTVLATNGVHEIVSVPFPAELNGQPVRFVRLRVTAPTP